MFLKSVWNLFLCVSLILASWGSSSAFYLPYMELTTMGDKPLTLIDTKRELKPLISKLMQDVADIYDAYEANNYYEQRNLMGAVDHELYSKNSELEYTNRVLVKTIEELIKSQTEIGGLIKVRTEKLQSEFTANIEAVEELKSQIAKIVAANEEQGKLMYVFVTVDGASESPEDEGDSESQEDERTSKSPEDESETEADEDNSESLARFPEVLRQMELDELQNSNDLQGASESPEETSASGSKEDEDHSESMSRLDEIFRQMELADLQGALESLEEESAPNTEEDKDDSESEERFVIFPEFMDSTEYYDRTE